MERHFHDSTDCTVTWSGEIKSSVWKSSGGQTKQLVPHLRDGTGGTGKFSRTKLKNNLSLYNDMMMTMTIKMATVPPTPKSNSAKMATTGSLLLILPLPLIQSSWLRATLTTGEQEGKGEITKKNPLLPLVSRRSTLLIHSMSTAAIVPLLAFSFELSDKQTASLLCWFVCYFSSMIK